MQTLGSRYSGSWQKLALHPSPPTTKPSSRKFCALAGVRSWSKLSEGLHCSVTQQSQEISFLPTRREGRAFMHMPELTVRVVEDSLPEQVGRALREAFQRCK